MMPDHHEPAPDTFFAELPHVVSGLQAALMEGADDVATKLEGPKLHLQIPVQPVSTALTRRQAQRFKVAKATACERRPRIATAHPVVDLEIGVRTGKRSALSRRGRCVRRRSGASPAAAESRI
jgi:hypothetical protein